MFKMQGGETFRPQVSSVTELQFLPRFFILHTHTHTLVGICEAVILVEYYFISQVNLLFLMLPSSHTNISLILSQDLQLSALLLYLDARLKRKSLYCHGLFFLLLVL